MINAWRQMVLANLGILAFALAGAWFAIGAGHYGVALIGFGLMAWSGWELAWLLADGPPPC